ncbi:MAG: hypothetical protein LBG05_00605 [Treponema sp.]|jgi:hypothetical protein|nr:hypothetical protein [Treponema sp.]
MKGKLFLSGILGVTLVFGLVLAGCGGEDDSNGNGGSNLNGIWNTDQAFGDVSFNNGNFERYADGSAYRRGTYTTNGSILTLVYTHVYGGYYGKPSLGWGNLESKWYSRSDIEALDTTVLPDKTEALSRWFVTASYGYSVDNSLLTFSEGGQVRYTFTRKN